MTLQNKMDAHFIKIYLECGDIIRILLHYIHVMSLLVILEKIRIERNLSLTSHDSRGFQLSPNGPEFERKWYGEYYNI